jgi:site-specific recombinase XerD
VDDIDRELPVAIVTGKGSRPRAVPFDDEAAKAVNRYILRARKDTTTLPSPGCGWVSAVA